jgi:hypothetical protein
MSAFSLYFIQLLSIIQVIFFKTTAVTNDSIILGLWLPFSNLSMRQTTHRSEKANPNWWTQY